MSCEKNRFSRQLEFTESHAYGHAHTRAVYYRRAEKKWQEQRGTERERKKLATEDKSIITRLNIIGHTIALGWINRGADTSMAGTKRLDFRSFPSFVAAIVSCDRHGQASSLLTSDKREFHAKITDTASVGTPSTGFRVQGEKNRPFSFLVASNANSLRTESFLCKGQAG